MMSNIVQFPDRGGTGFSLLLTRTERISRLYDVLYDVSSEVEFYGTQACAMRDINCAIVLLTQLNTRNDFSVMVRLKLARKNIELTRYKVSILESLDTCMEIVSRWMPKQYSRLDMLLARLT